MLELRNIVKDYVSGNNVTHALKGISVTFRKNEFVSILGASGCGKTTLLNIIGGLDRYTTGDLLILGKSTKEYTDRDWDTYRNHSIGFVFQTYNLISHQNILKNVELALTISGVSKNERRKRAYEALKVVCLEGMEKKKPNQLSGGQCQRVAIARALINNPEILLADEPTGALDSETSIQIMDLLKEVAKNRLVIMVTHNPELAQKYSTRIIKMSDGLLVDDSNPFDFHYDVTKPSVDVKKEKQKFFVKPSNKELIFIISSGISVLFSIFTLVFVLVKFTLILSFVYLFVMLAYIVFVLVFELKFFKNENLTKVTFKLRKREKIVKEKKTSSKGSKKKTSMSLGTSIGLSTSNLISKLKRTILVTIAGSIGIIGVSAVLAVSRGVKEYVSSLQNDMLSSYPLTIEEESIDYTSLMSGFNKNQTREHYKFDPENPKVGVDSMISYLMEAYSDFTNVKTNTIDEKLVSYIDEMDKTDVGALSYEYGIDPTNNIFGKWIDQRSETEDYYSFNGLTQRYIAELKTVDGFGQYASFVDLFTSFMRQMPDNRDYILGQYDVLAGKDPTLSEDELILVVDGDTTLTDILFGQMGMFDHDSFINIANCAMGEQELKSDPDFDKKTQAEKDEAIQKIREEFPYSRDFAYEDLIGHEFYYFPQDTIYSKDNHVSDEKTTISLSFSIMKGGNLDTFVTLNLQSYAGFNLLFGTSIHIDGTNSETKTIACLNSKSINPDGTKSDWEVNKKEDLAGKWYAFEPTSLVGADIANIETLASSIKFAFELNETVDKVTMLEGFLFNKKGAEATPLWNETSDPIKGYSYNAIADKEWIKNPSSSELNGKKLTISSILRLRRDKQFGSLRRGLYYSKAFSDLYIKDSVNAKVSKALKEHMSKKITYNTEFQQAYVKFPYYDFKKLEMKYNGYASTLNADLTSSISDLFSNLIGVDYFEQNCKHLRSLCGQKATMSKDDEGVLSSVEFNNLPTSIEIYPKSFEGKNKITSYLDKWNSDDALVINGKRYDKNSRDDLTYSDPISLIVSVINTFIDAITISLVVFTSLSLVVSCFMIAVITYISVVERIKEIGVIRSLGGRKRDVANLFVMETFMTGLFSGIFGIGMTYILQIIVNLILKAEFGIVIMNLTIPTALLMIFVSVMLSILSGLIPSQSAAHKDPVVALRSNE